MNKPKGWKLTGGEDENRRSHGEEVENRWRKRGEVENGRRIGGEVKNIRRTRGEVENRRRTGGERRVSSSSQSPKEMPTREFQSVTEKKPRATLKLLVLAQAPSRALELLFPVVTEVIARLPGSGAKMPTTLY
ncbi:hypothetical protein DY000_02051745 [Brassica cretica]|uniref:Uncharacterized protein n=1 Tax=Brassica cretica TaxID=69181 RepID=A0ABQ7AIK6_BRACR|nr:hypothetical protein DY000_02051745 [Brassica cretica]